MAGSELIPREEWQDDLYRRNLDNGFIDPAAEYPIATPQIASGDDLDAEMRNDVLRYVNSVDVVRGTHPLAASSQWNTIASGSDALLDTSDPVLTQYKESHRESVRMVDHLLRENYPAILASFKAGIETGVADGYIPSYVMGRWDAVASMTPVQVYDAILDEEGERAVAFYDIVTDQTSLRHDGGLDRLELSRHLKHELGHKLSGGQFRQLELEDDITGDLVRVPRRMRGGFWNLSRRHDRHRGLTEAVNEHIALASEDGSFATLDPDLRPNDSEAYVWERKLLLTFIERSSGLVDFKTICRASFEDNDDFADRLAMATQAFQAYGIGAYSKLDKLMVKVDAMPISDKKGFRALVDRIHPPVLGDDGSVIEHGWIDVDDLDETDSKDNQAGESQ